MSPTKKQRLITCDSGHGESELQHKSGRHLSKRQRAQGKLKDFRNMPLDIAEEVFRQLDPLDLLQLMRTSKSLRAMLKYRGNNRLWMRARSNVPDLPPCPDHLSEPAYASLMFESYCFSCSKPNVKRIFYNVNVRHCKSCTDSVFVASPPLELPEVVRSALNDIIPRDYNKYYKPSLDDLEKSDLEKSLRKIDGDAQELEALIARLSARRISMEKHARPLLRWTLMRDGNHRIELEARRKMRVDQIALRLEELGYVDVLENPWVEAWQTIPGVRRAETLTENSWNKIKPIIVESLERCRTDIIQRQRTAAQFKLLGSSIFKEAYDEYTFSMQADLSVREPLPSASDVFLHIIRKAEGMLRRQDFPPEVLDQHISNWRASVKQSVTELLPDELVDLASESGVDPLDMACAVFTCQLCPPAGRPILSYPEVFTHSCCFRSLAYLLSDIFDILPIHNAHVRKILAMYTIRPWTPEPLVFNQRSSLSIKSILRACGKPLAYTRADLDNFDFDTSNLECSGIFLRCGTCNNISENLHRIRDIVMSWRAALLHYHSPTHSAEEADEVLWMPLARQDIEELRNTQHARHMYGLCPLCHLGCNGTYYQSPTVLELHLREKHPYITFGSSITDITFKCTSSCPGLCDNAPAHFHRQFRTSCAHAE